MTLLALLAGVAVAVTSSASTGTPKPPAAQLRLQKAQIARLTRAHTADATLIAALKRKLAGDGDTVDKLNAKLGENATAIHDLGTKLAAANASVATLSGQVTTLTSQVSQQAQGGLAAVLAGSPDDLWNAVVAIYARFPTLPADQVCGYDKTTDTTPGPPPTGTDYTFTQWAGACAG